MKDKSMITPRFLTDVTGVICTLQRVTDEQGHRFPMENCAKVRGAFYQIP